MSYRLLMVDDNLKNISATKRFLEMNGFTVDATESAEECLNLLEKNEYALLLLDYNMPEIMGHSLTEKIKASYPQQQVAIFSCDLSREAIQQSYRSGAMDFLEKHLQPHEILSRIQLYCNRYDLLLKTIRVNRQKSENQSLIESVGMIGQTDIMADIAKKIHKFAQAKDVTVFIGGQSGTGKELAAKAIHNLSARSKGPLVALSCANIPTNLLESELFGHAKGAFTGATENKDGKFFLANAGTIFLDEVAELTMEMQAKLLRVLQERVIDPVGARTNKKIDVRVISATCKDLDQMVKEGKFREDLLYRLRVVDLMMPALTERIADIEPLVAFFTEKFNKQYGFVKHFQHRTLEILKRQPWKGNVRELSSVIEKHLVMCDKNVITPDDLDLNLYKSGSTASGPITLDSFEEEQKKEKIDFLKKMIEQMGSKAEAARSLGIKPNHLHYLLADSNTAKNKKDSSTAEIALMA